MRTPILSLLALLPLTASLSAQIVVVDGTLDASYGAPLAVQAVQTGFGDNQSEFDALYGRIDEGNLFLFLSGNLESNFNKAEIFIDSMAGGQNVLAGNNPDIDFNGLNRMGTTATQPGLTFDAGFEADRYITLGRNTSEMFVNFATLSTGGGGSGTFLGSIATPNPNQQGSGIVSQPGFATIAVGYNDANVGGVGGNQGAEADQAAAAAVTTGLELSISLADLGFSSGPLRISAFINGTGHDFLSNQALGTFPVGTLNLGEPRIADFNNLAGDQYVTVVPEPGSLVLLGLAGAIVAAHRRRC